MKTIPTQTLTILSTALAYDGNAVRIVEKLDRVAYLDVNKVLEACGGKWDRKAKAHLFPSNAAERLEEVITSGQYTNQKDELAFFETPAPLAQLLVGLLQPMERGGIALEPSAGSGRLVDALLAAGMFVVYCERDVERRLALYDRMPAQVGMLPEDDFLDYDPRKKDGFKGFDACAMNPPFKKVGKGDHLDHVQYAYELLNPNAPLVAVLPRSIEFRADRRHALFRQWVTNNGGRIESLPDGSFKESGTSVRTSIVLMRKRRSDLL